MYCICISNHEDSFSWYASLMYFESTSQQTHLHAYLFVSLNDFSNIFVIASPFCLHAYVIL